MRIVGRSRMTRIILLSGGSNGESTYQPQIDVEIKRSGSYWDGDPDWARLGCFSSRLHSAAAKPEQLSQSPGCAGTDYQDSCWTTPVPVIGLRGTCRQLGQEDNHPQLRSRRLWRHIVVGHRTLSRRACPQDWP